MLPHKVKIRGKKYRVYHTRRLIDKDAHGMCESDRPQIWIDLDQKPGALHETILHEALHAAIPDLHEQAVTQTAQDISKFLRQYFNIKRK